MTNNSEFPTAALRILREASHVAVLTGAGTSALVHSAASLPLIALENKATVIEINPQTTPLTRWMDFVLTGTAGALLPQLVTRLKE